MKLFAISALLLICAGLAPLAFGAEIPRIEHTRDLGFGFRRVVIAGPSASSFESIGHFEYLFYRDRKLSQLGKCAVAPSGNSVVYQDGPSGNIFLFSRTDERIVQLTGMFRGLVDKFDWHEHEGFISAILVCGKEKSTIKLQIPRKT